MLDEFPGGGETGEVLRATDWASSPLGPVAGWSMSLKSLVRAILHARQPMILWWGPELIQFYNDAMLESMRDKHPKGMGQPGREAWQQAWLAVGHELQQVVDVGAAIWNEDMFVPVDRNGGLEDAWWTYSYSPVFDDDGTRNGILIVCTETTSGVVARRSLEQARREAERARVEQHEAFMQASTAIAILAGETLTFTFANPAYERLVARPVLGRTLDEAFGAEEVQGYRAIIQKVLDTGAPVDLRASELRLLGADGTVDEKYIDVSYHPYRNAEGKTVGVVAMVNDVTLVVNAQRQAEENSRLKDEFLATVSHELRTPLNAILGWSQMMLAADMPPERARRALETVERNARAQSQLINDLLDVARITSGKLKLEVETLYLAVPVESALEAVRPAADARGVTLKATLDPLLAVRGDGARIQQIAWNLLSNAVKFTPRGGKVVVTLERRQSSAVLGVVDDGRGIDAAFLPHVFDKFRQAHGSSTREHGGLGLGLAIVKQLVELHGGVVSASSPGAGQGTTFEVRLPISAVLAPPLGTGLPAAASPDLVFPPELVDRKILVVDDETDTRELLVAILEQAGARVESASNVAEALVRFDQSRPDVLLSDIGMPGEDGHALIRRIRARPATEGGRTPAVALTAFARVEDRTAALRAGFRAHLPKPVEPAELLAVLASVVPDR